MIFDEYISLGESCCSALALKEIGLRKKSYPFDWVWARPSIILDVLEKDFKGWTDEVITNSIIRNKYRIDISHYLYLSEDIRKNILQRRIDRLLNILNSGKSICFIYTCEKSNILGWDVEKEYEDLIKLLEYINLNFSAKIKCICININKKRFDNNLIKNYSVNLEKNWIDKDYRKSCSELLKKVILN